MLGRQTMEPEELNEKKNKAQGWIKKRYPHLSIEDAEDFGAYCVDVWLSGGEKRDWRHVAIDYLRKHGHRTGSRGNSDAMGSLARKRLEEVDEESEREIEQYPVQSRRPDESHSFRYSGLESRLRVVLVLMYEWGFTELEIGHCLGVSESRVAQMHHAALRVQRKVLQAEGLSKAQIEASRILQAEISRGLQERSPIQSQGSGAMEKIQTQKGQGMGARALPKVQETLLGTFRVSSW